VSVQPNDPKAQAETLLVPYQDGRYNLLVPVEALREPSPYYKLSVVVVKVNPDPEGGDVYPLAPEELDKGDAGLFSLAKPAVYRLTSAAGGDFEGVTCLTSSEKYCMYHADLVMIDCAGKKVKWPGDYDVDLQVEEDLLLERNRRTYAWLQRQTSKQGKEGDDARRRLKGYNDAEAFARDKTTKAMVEKRRNKLKLAQTGAMLRAAKAALGLRPHYRLAELHKPFVIVRVDFQPDLSNPLVQQAIAAQYVNAMLNLGIKQHPNLVAPQERVIDVAMDDDRPPMDDEDTQDGRAAAQPQQGVAQPAQAPNATATATEAPPAPAAAPQQPETAAPPAPQPPAPNMQEARQDLMDTIRGVAPASGLAPDAHQATVQPPAPATQPPKSAAKAGPVVHTCSIEGCGAKISQGIADYSVGKYGQKLCYRHQREADAKAKGAQ
jgi:hypothetical protein